MIVRVKSRVSYTKASNVIINDPNISLKAKGLWLLLMSKRDDWNVTIGGTSSQTKEGPYALKPIFKELERAGYLKRHTSSTGKNKISTTTTLFEEPQLSIVRKGTHEQESSVDLFTADDFSSDVKVGAIVTTDLLSTETVIEKELPPQATTPAKADEPSTNNKRGTDFLDPEHLYDLRKNDIPYARQVLRNVNRYELTSDDIEPLRKLVGVHGKATFLTCIRWFVSDEGIENEVNKEFLAKGMIGLAEDCDNGSDDGWCHFDIFG